MRYKTRQNSTFQINISVRILLFSILVISFSCKNKEEHRDKYYSTEANIDFRHNTKMLQDRSKNELKEKEFIKKLDYLKLFADYVQTEQTDTTINPFKSIYRYNIFTEYYDSLDNINKKQYQQNKIRESNYGNITDEHWNSLFSKKIGTIPLAYIIRFDTIDNTINDIRIIFYTNDELDNSGSGYWIAISTNKGKTWQHYYTGLNTDFLYVKPKSKIPFRIDKNHIQFEATLLKPYGPNFTHGHEAFTKIKDGIIVKIDLNKITKDSDNDGLTDIMESKLMTNPFSKDTDKDGIPDSSDCNPLHKSIDNKYTLLYRYLIEQWETIHSSFISYNDTNNLKNNMISKTKLTYLIITSDKNLFKISHLHHRYIIVSSYYQLQNGLKTIVGLNQFYISPLYKIDNLPNFYKIHISHKGLSQSIIVGETKTGWVIKRMSSALAD